MERQNFNIVVVEDNSWYNKLLVYTLKLNPDYNVVSFTSGKELLDNLNNDIDLITLDYRLEDYDGSQLLIKIRDFNPDIKVIVISEQSEITVAVQLLKDGAYDYLVKSDDIRERLLNTTQNALNVKNLERKIETLQNEVTQKYEFSNSIIGNSDTVKRVHQLVGKAVTNNITVIVTGETGTGKEVVSKAIHYNSVRSKEPFVAINMAAIPADLLESELFGHEKGAFTGAHARRIGKFEEAGKGTLFLDEIGEMEMSFQAKLLRALQEREFNRVGSNEMVKIESRIIVATNRDLLHEVREGKFREDLYYRLFGLQIHLPPLRERDKDAILLSRFFIKNFCKDNGMEDKELSDAAKDKILKYSWPGNIRELKSVVELSVIMANGNVIEAEDVTVQPQQFLQDLMLTERSMRDYEIEIVKYYMRRFNNNTKMVADHLKIGQTTVYRILKEAEINN